MFGRPYTGVLAHKITVFRLAVFAIVIIVAGLTYEIEGEAKALLVSRLPCIGRLSP